MSVEEQMIISELQDISSQLKKLVRAVQSVEQAIRHS